MIIKAIDIKYDTDGRKVKLPPSIYFRVDDMDEVELGETMDENLADWISDETGWCVLACGYEKVDNVPPGFEAVDVRVNGDDSSSLDAYDIGYEEGRRKQ